MPTQRLAIRLGRGTPAADEVAYLHTGLSLHGALTGTQANHVQVQPRRLPADSLGVAQHGVGTPLRTAMPLLLGLPAGSAHLNPQRCRREPPVRSHYPSPPGDSWYECCPCLARV